MKIIPLYHYKRENGGVTVSPIKPSCEYTEQLRLVADDDKMLTKDGCDLRGVVDVTSVDGWYEVEEPTELGRQYTETDEPIKIIEAKEEIV